MNSKERVRRAFSRKELPDRIPVQFDLCKSLIEHFAKELSMDTGYALSYYEDLTYRISANGIRTAMGSDVIVVGGTEAAEFESVQLEGNISINEFGMKMKPTELYVEVVEPPLKDASSQDDINNYDFPDPGAPGRFDAARKDIAEYGDDYFVIGDCELSIFELAWQLTGLEKHLMAMAMQESWLNTLYDRVEHWTTNIALQLVGIGVDALWFGEDLGTQTTTLMSPDMWREKFKPRYHRMIKKLKEKTPGIIVMTMGEYGSMVYDGETIYKGNAMPVEVVDTLGAGDSYISAFLSSRLMGKNIPDSIKAGHLAATEICKRLGGWGGEP